MADLVGNDAVVSQCGKYRYRLDRHVGGGGNIFAFFGVNPSTADASVDDHTVRKWLGFCRKWEASRFIVGNVCAFRATDVRELAKVEDPFGSENPEYHYQIAQEADVLVPCWGARGKMPKTVQRRADLVMAFLLSTGKPVKCFGTTASGDPKHPLTLGYATPLVDFPKDGA